MPSTFVHGFLPSSCALASQPQLKNKTTRSYFVFFAICFILGNMPDLDILPATIDRANWENIHRYWGHNLFSITVWICIGAWALKKYVGGEYSGKKRWWLAGLLVGSHVLFDAMGEMTPRGVRVGVPLLWPVSRWEFIFPLSVFKSYEVDHQINPIAAHITSASFWHNAFMGEILYSSLFFGIWVAGFQIYRLAKNPRPTYLRRTRKR